MTVSPLNTSDLKDSMPAPLASALIVVRSVPTGYFSRKCVLRASAESGSSWLKPSHRRNAGSPPTNWPSPNGFPPTRMPPLQPSSATLAKVRQIAAIEDRLILVILFSRFDRRIGECGQVRGVSTLCRLLRLAGIIPAGAERFVLRVEIDCRVFSQ